MAGPGLLKELLKSKASGNHLFPSIRNDIATEQEEIIRNFSWRGFASPSAGLTRTSCPVDFFARVQVKTKFKIETVYKMNMGKKVHELIQDRLKTRLSHMLYDPPNITSEYAIKSLAKIWPEVPVYDDNEFLVSGRIDAVLKVQDAPLVLDIKTTSVTGDAIEAPKLIEVLRQLDELLAQGMRGEQVLEKARTKVNELLKEAKESSGKWEKHKEKCPSPEYEMQAETYCALANHLGYYDKKIRRCGLAMINLCIPSGDLKAEYEKYWAFTEEREAEILEQLRCFARHCRAARAKTPIVECDWRGCHKHGVKANVVGG